MKYTITMIEVREGRDPVVRVARISTTDRAEAVKLAGWPRPFHILRRVEGPHD